MTVVDLQVVVIGSGRSGTAWAAQRLTDLGVPCGHESVFDWHPSSRHDRRLDYDGRTPSPFEPPADVPLQAEASLAAIAYLSTIPTECDVWHVVRNPAHVVSSWMGRGVFDDPRPLTPYARFVAAHVPAVFHESSPAARAARWVAEWNLRGDDACHALGLSYQMVHVDGDEPAVNASTHPLLSYDEIVRVCSPMTRTLFDAWAETSGYDEEMAS